MYLDVFSVHPAVFTKFWTRKKSNLENDYGKILKKLTFLLEFSKVSFNLERDVKWSYFKKDCLPHWTKMFEKRVSYCNILSYCHINILSQCFKKSINIPFIVTEPKTKWEVNKSKLSQFSLCSCRKDVIRVSYHAFIQKIDWVHLIVTLTSL